MQYGSAKAAAAVAAAATTGAAPEPPRDSISAADKTQTTTSLPNWLATGSLESNQLVGLACGCRLPAALI